VSNVTDHEYALKIYRLIFKVEDDGGDAYIQGIWDAIESLEPREKDALEYRYRHDMTLIQVAEKLGCGSAKRATLYVDRATLKLRHSSRSSKMSMAKIVAELEECKHQVKSMNANVYAFQKLIFMLSQGIPVDVNMQECYNPRMLTVFSIGLSSRTANGLVKNGIETVEDIIKIDSYEYLLNLRTFGEKGADDIIACMREEGFSAWADKIELSKQEADHK
jgi:hypothetical protein